MTARLLACLVLPMIAMDPAAAQTATAAAPTVKPAREKLICKGDRNSSSRIAPKICKTPAQWNATAGADADQAAETARRGIVQSRGM